MKLEEMKVIIMNEFVNKVFRVNGARKQRKGFWRVQLVSLDVTR